MTTGLIHWFEIPVRDMARAQKFYTEVFQISMHEGEMSGLRMCFFPQEESSHGKGSGALVLSPEIEPGNLGTVIYFEAGDDLSPILARVEPSGGKVLVPKTPIAPHAGYYTHFLDTEGNKIALYSRT